MARMWPRELPDEILSNPLRSSEVRVYMALASSLDDSYVVFYSRPWLGLTWDGREIDGECDFVVAHPNRGMLAIEVKGGGIEYNPEEERWFSVDRYGCRHNIKNPVAQARTSKHELLRKLREDTAWRGRYIRARHGVILPDCLPSSSDLGADMPRGIFCFADRFERDLPDWVQERLGGASTTKEEPLGDNGIRVLERLLAKPFRLRTSLAPSLREDARVQDYLTTQQYHILSMLDSLPRAAIAGAAGTGKTILAVEKARRCADVGMATLFVCYNRPLATAVAELLTGVSVRVETFHGLCAWMAREAGMDIPKGESSEQLFDDIYPSLLADSAELRHDIRFDAIIVDEGQDFMSHWWAAIDALLEPSPGSNLYVFFDSNQRVYGSVPSLPGDASLLPIRLTRNLRNTKAIHATASAFYEGFAIQAAGPQGTEPEWFVVEPARISKAVAEKVTELVRHEKVDPESIAVLVPNRSVRDELIEDNCLGAYPVHEAGNRGTHSTLTVDTIRRFKGLESPVVVLVVPEALTEELAYVAFSRARSHLIVIGADGPVSYLCSVIESSE